MKILLWLAGVFINTFGITQPTPENERRVAIYAGVLLLLIVSGLVVVAIVLRGYLHG